MFYCSKCRRLRLFNPATRACGKCGYQPRNPPTAKDIEKDCENAENWRQQRKKERQRRDQTEPIIATMAKNSTTEEMMAKTDLPRITVRRILKKLGLDSRKPGPKPSPKPKPFPKPKKPAPSANNTEQRLPIDDVGKRIIDP